MFQSLLFYFSDAVLRAPTIGCMLMCLTAALVGVIVFLKKESLIGESLSHAAYPGVILGVIVAGGLDIDDDQEFMISLLVMIGAFFTAMCGLFLTQCLVSKFKVRSDSALCFVLASFFGIGLTLASHVQFSYSSLYRKAQVYLYGQAATMTDVHILIYGILALTVTLSICIFYKEIETISFDQEYAKSVGINTKLVNGIVFFLIALAVVIGIRSVGVVLMSAMLIAPAAAARQYTNTLYKIFIIAAVFGVLSGYFGNYYSVEISNYLSIGGNGNQRVVLPTGPVIVLIASLICLFSLMFAPKKGLLFRLIRVLFFRYRCMRENLLKAIWRVGPSQEVSFNHIAKYQSASPLYLQCVLNHLTYDGWLKKSVGGYTLTKEGAQLASRIVRLHRLWEVYLVDYLGVGSERVHRSAEEMEHIITPSLEAELTVLLQNPRMDPHHQPIPSMESETL